MQIPVYLFTGFLESGKTTFIVDTLRDPNFSEGQKTLVIVCEEGELDYEDDLVEETNSVIVYLESQEELTSDLLAELQKKHKPDQVIIEYNGMWPMSYLQQIDLPRKWVLAEILTTVDASTFQNYMNNMRSIIMDQFSQSDVLIFNRCQPDTPKASFGRTVKASNRRVRLIYENADGTIDNNVEEELPFDIEADVIDLEDEDYGIWYIDAMEHPEKYEGKKIRFTAIVFKDRKMPEGVFVPGRHAMTCCADDIAFLGFLCKTPAAKNLKIRDWIKVEADIKIENLKEYHGDGPVLYATCIEKAEKPKEELVYF